MNRVMLFIFCLIVASSACASKRSSDAGVAPDANAHFGMTVTEPEAVSRKDWEPAAFKVAGCPEQSSKDFGRLGWEDTHPLGKGWTSWLATQSVPGTVTVVATGYDSDNGVKESSGTGLIINVDGTVLTARHVVEGALFVTVAPRHEEDGEYPSSSRAYPVKVVLGKGKRDVALLVPKYPQHLPIGYLHVESLDLPEPCETVWQFGQKSGWSYGLVPQKIEREIDGTIKMALLSDFGDSGAPVADEYGSVIGIVLSIRGKHDEYTNVLPIAAAFKALGIRFKAP